MKRLTRDAVSPESGLMKERRHWFRARGFTAWAAGLGLLWVAMQWASDDASRPLLTAFGVAWTVILVLTLRTGVVTSDRGVGVGRAVLRTRVYVWDDIVAFDHEERRLGGRADRGRVVLGLASSERVQLPELRKTAPFVALLGERLGLPRKL